MNVQNINTVRAVLEKHYIDAVVMEDINPKKCRDRQYLIWLIAEEIFGEEWADDMTKQARRNYMGGKYDEY